MKNRPRVGIAPALLLVVMATASAAPVPITSYDVEQTPGSGWGCWFHNYTGAITNTGRTIAPGCAPQTPIFNYSGGSGTLNDGLMSTDIAATHLFTTMNAEDGQPISPMITLHLGGVFLIKQISLFGGDIGGNAIPGALDGVTVEIGGTPVTLVTTPFGPPNALGVPINDLLDLTGTPLATMPTDEIVLKDFTASLFGSSFDQFSITEITASDTSSIPEPSMLSLLLCSLASLGVVASRRTPSRHARATRAIAMAKG